MSYIELKNICKKFGRQDIIKKLNISIKEGEFVTLLGSSGSGKSTLLKCLAGLEKVNEGAICLDNVDITKSKSKDRNIGMIFQQYNLFPTKTVFENISFGMKMKKENKRYIKSSVGELMKTIQLEGYENKYPSQLSGGEQQRVALARSIAIKPKVMLYDEPLSAIDAKLRKELQREIKRIHKDLNMTSIFVTHDQEEAMVLSDRIFLMNDGKIEQEGTPAELYENPKSLFVANFIGNYNVFSSEEMKKLFKGDKWKNHYIFRPESLKYRRSEVSVDYFKAKGAITDIVYHGNFNRIYIEIKDTIIKMDISSFEKIVKRIGDITEIFIDKKDIIEVSN